MFTKGKCSTVLFTSLWATLRNGAIFSSVRPVWSRKPTMQDHRNFKYGVNLPICSVGDNSFSGGKDKDLDNMELLLLKSMLQKCRRWVLMVDWDYHSTATQISCFGFVKCVKECC